MHAGGLCERLSLVLPEQWLWGAMVESPTLAQQHALSNALPFLSLGHGTCSVSSLFVCSSWWSILFHSCGTCKRKSKLNQRRKLKKHSLISFREDMSNLKKRYAVDFHIQRTLLALYLSNLLVQLLIQAVFLAILIRALLPKVNGLPISYSARTRPTFALHMLKMWLKCYPFIGDQRNQQNRLCRT